jgi:hypothetical protein
MIVRSRFRPRRVPEFLLVCIALLLSLPAAAQKVGELVDLTGEASVVIFDDIESDRSETRYYLIEARKNRETRLHFKGRVPDAFATGTQVRVRGRGRKDGVEVESVAELDGPAVVPKRHGGGPRATRDAGSDHWSISTTQRSAAAITERPCRRWDRMSTRASRSQACFSMLRWGP